GLLTKSVTSLYVSKWSGSAWNGMGNIASVFGPGAPSSGTLAFRAGSIPVVAYQYPFSVSYTVAVVTYTHGSWVSITPGVSIAPTGYAISPRVLVDPTDNGVVVAVAANSEGGISVVKAVSGQWKKMGGDVDSPLLFSAYPAD